MGQKEKYVCRTKPINVRFCRVFFVEHDSAVITGTEGDH